MTAGRRPGTPSPTGSRARPTTSFAVVTRSARATDICAPPTTIARPSSSSTGTRAIRGSPTPIGEAWTATRPAPRCSILRSSRSKSHMRARRFRATCTARTARPVRVRRSLCTAGSMARPRKCTSIGARAAVERGLNAFVFDGPGQFGPLHREGLTFRPDWETVVTPVVDFVLKLPGVDPKRVALMGTSLAGCSRRAPPRSKSASPPSSPTTASTTTRRRSSPGCPPEERESVKGDARCGGIAPALDEALDQGR